MLANSQAQDLMEHLKAVAHLSKQMAIRMGMSPELVAMTYTAGLLHDIGKVVSPYQKNVKKCTTLDDFADPNNGYPFHHEIGWAFLTTKLGDVNLLNTVYWHHARPKHDFKTRQSNDASLILSKVSPEDIKALEKMFQSLDIDPLFLGNLIPAPVAVPNLFYEDDSTYNSNKNAELMLIRSCVISADRYIATLPAQSLKPYAEGKNLIEVIDTMLAGHIYGDVKCPTGQNYDPERFQLHRDIVTAIGDSRTTIVKAPAGLGKTVIGLLWAKLRQGKVLWVCPRNVVADSVYETLVSEIKALNLDCSVELYRTCSRQKTNKEDGRPEFDSDIIVTNLDAVMSPMIKSLISGRLFTVYGAHIVLDEFHEFVSDAPLFAAFVTYMRARHRLSNTCKTLLLSATPSMIQALWDTVGNKTLVLPDEKTHYPAHHNGVYAIDFATEFPDKATPGNLLVCNSVRWSQDNYTKGDFTQVIHHRYTESDRAEREDKIRQYFGKWGTGVLLGESLSAALVVQAAMDISFKRLHDSVCSPESTLQRIGRTDRWGNFQNDHPSITFIDKSTDRSEMGAINTVYNLKLQRKWYAFLKERLKDVSSVDLNTMYRLYNEFNHINRIDLMSYIRERYNKGMNGNSKDMTYWSLVSFIPYMDLSVDPDRPKKQSRNLRSPNGSYFYTVELYGKPNKWLAPDDVLNEGFELFARYNKDSTGNLSKGLNNTGAMITRLKGLVDCGYTAWTRTSKSKSNLPKDVKEWFSRARFPGTPFPDFSCVYHPELGVIRK